MNHRVGFMHTSVACVL